MDLLESLQNDLDILQIERSNLIESGWCLQNCWLVQVKPGGTARTNRCYWQVRSRKEIFDGKKLKHLKPDEVELYQAAIERGRQLKQIDAQISKVQQQLRRTIKQIKRSRQSASAEPAHHLSVNHSLPNSLPNSLPDRAASPDRAIALQKPVKQQESTHFSSFFLPTHSNSDVQPKRADSLPSTEPETPEQRAINRSRELRSQLRQTIDNRRALVAQNRLLREQHKQAQAVIKSRSAELFSNASVHVNNQVSKNSISNP